MGVIGVSSQKPIPKDCTVLVREASVAQVESHAVAAAVKSQYEPAEELCLPVRSEYKFVYQYEP